MINDSFICVIDYGKLVGELTSPCSISEGSLASSRLPPVPIPNPPISRRPVKESKAVWDTGATGTTISQEIVNELGLIASGITWVKYANGYGQNQLTYVVDVGLPNGVTIPGIQATVADPGIDEGIHVLLGMDIIQTGDFIVNTSGERTKIVFRVPSGGPVEDWLSFLPSIV